MTKPKVLYVDDETDLLDIAASFFEDEGIELETCSDFHDAIEMVRNNKYDLIISDAKMPSGSGTELTLIMKKELQFKGKILLVTGIAQDHPHEIGYDHIVYKPIEFQELVNTVKKLLV